jgi:hypothetical protein
MIFHASLPADDPARVARALGEVLGGSSKPFQNWPGGYVARGGPDDEHVTMIEVYPRTMPAVPGQDDEMVQVGQDKSPSRYACFHLAVGTPLSIEQVLAIAAREGWRAKHMSRKGAFDVIEYWLENTIMLELLTPEMQQTYKTLVSRHRIRPGTEQAPAIA